MHRLMPHEASFFELFSDLAGTVHEGSKALVDLVANFTDVRAKASKIKELEHRGDNITHEVMRRLNQTFITPFDREDIHELASTIDDVLDLTDAAAGRLVTYNVARIRPGVLELAELLERTAGQVVAAVGQLEKHDEIMHCCIEINQLENEGDRVSRQLIAGLFVDEKDPVEIIKWKEIIEVMETAIDKCEDVANVIESVVLKNA
ncbi:MAG: DUF47 domain-containing protein [Acidobacteria bacterium]|nr:DUF47 domain-containing protein [Acidobacteriota bacterium]